jgi:hypothetical protein
MRKVATPSGERRPVRNAWLALRTALGVVAGLTLAASAAFAQSAGACTESTQQASTACRTAATSDHALALGACVNISDAAARKTCRTQAGADYKDAVATCGDQRAARSAVCK